MKRLIERRSPRVTDRLPPDVDPVLRRVLLARGIGSAAELEHRLADLLPVSRLGGLARAVAVLERHRGRSSRIMVIGDFDADGATGTALMVRTLRELGTDVSYLVPNRFEFGYGLTPGIVELASESGADLLITVDNGISSLEGVERARELGMDVVVTDHHLPGVELPPATAIVNPNIPGEEFPSKALAGVGVAFYLMAAAVRDDARARSALADRLELVALGTVADVVPLDRNNRILVSEGLRRIRAGRGAPGLRALLTQAGRDWRRVVAADLGYGAAPRLNAAGRLDDMSLGIECLLADDEANAAGMAAQLGELNAERREIESRMHAQAVEALQALELAEDGGALPPCLCLYDPSWHQGVVGLLASRVKDRLHRPVVAFAPGDRDSLKGSARSISGLHIRDTLDSVAASHPGLLQKFGGHAMAAGLSLRLQDLEQFRAALIAEVERREADMDCRGTLWSDGELRASEISLATAERLREAMPWGQHFPEPLFDGEFRLEDRRIVGERHLRLKLRPRGAGGRAVDAIAFNYDAAPLPEGDALRLVFRLDVNDYRGLRSPQLVVEYLEPL